ncbi:MAG: minor curlin subunit [Alteromonadaceae bacterium]|jgi:minor curlin subunit
MKVKGNSLGCFLFVFLIINLAFYSHSGNANDLLSGPELQDSPLSLSLTTTAAITIDNQTQQLVINQYGIHNKATVNQVANVGNSIAINQDGMDNLANLLQTGYGNTINLYQQGNGNFAEVIQEGNTNLVNIVQEGEQTFIVHQIGNDMVVNITQY